MTDRVVDYTAVARRLLHQESLPADGTAPLAQLLRSTEVRRLRAGAVLMREGEPADELLVIARGVVRVHLRDLHGRPTEVALLEAPLLLGHIAIIDDGMRSATCEMASTGLVLALARDRVEAVFTETSRGAEVMRELMLAGMFRKLDQATERLRDFVRAQPPDPVPVRSSEPQ